MHKDVKFKEKYSLDSVVLCIKSFICGENVKNVLPLDRLPFFMVKLLSFVEYTQVVDIFEGYINLLK